MASVTIARDAGYADRVRAYKILLDGQPLGELVEADLQAFPIAPGAHQLEARIDWCGSAPIAFTAAADSDLKFIVESNLRGPKIALALFYIAFARKSYLRLRQVEDLSDIETAPAPVEIDRKRFILKSGVLGWGLTTGVFWSLFMYLWTDHPPSVWLLVAMLPIWLIAGAAWGAIMWRFFNRRFGAEIAARNARIATRRAEGRTGRTA